MTVLTDISNPTELVTLTSPEDVLVPPPDPEVAAQRAFKAQFAIPNMDIGYDELFHMIVSGQESEVRSKAATQIDQERAAHVQRSLTSLTKDLKRPLSEPEIARVTGLVREYHTPTNPSTVMEDMYSVGYVEKVEGAAKRRPGSEWEEAKSVLPNEIEEDKKRAIGIIAKIEKLRHYKEDAQNKLKNQSVGGFTWDMAKQFIFPGYTEYEQRGNVPGVSQFNLLGTNKKAQREALLKLSTEEFDQVLKDVSEKLDPIQQLDFFDKMLGMSTSDEVLDNLWTPLEAAGVAGAVKLGVKGVHNLFLWNQARRTLRDMVRAANADASNIMMAEAVGDAKEAAVQRATANFNDAVKGTTDAPKEAREALPSILRPDITDIEGHPGSIGREGANRLVAATNSFASNVLDTVANILRVERIPASLASEKALRAIYDDVAARMPGTPILDINNLRVDPFTGTKSVEVHVGKPGNELFHRMSDAQAFAENHGYVGYTINKKGYGYHITFRKPVDETSDAVRDAMKTVGTTDPVTWQNVFSKYLSKFRNPDDTLSLDHRMNRKVATYAANSLLKIAKEEAAYITALRDGWRKNAQRDPITGRPMTLREKIMNPMYEWERPAVNPIRAKQKWTEWKRFVDTLQRKEGPDGIQGVDLSSPLEVQQEYNRLFKRMPDMDEIEAYFAYKRLKDMDLLLRNLAVYKNKARVGTEQHSIVTIGEDGAKINSEFFDGIRRKGLSFTTDDGVMILDGKGGMRYDFADRFGKVIVDDTQEKLKNGQMQVIELYDPASKPLKGFAGLPGDARVRFVIMPSSNVSTQPIPWHQVPRRGGGHHEFDYQYFIKQANVVPTKSRGKFQHWYEGDTTIMPVSIRAMGEKAAQRLDTVRELLRKGKEAEAEAFYASNSIGEDWGKVKSWFYESRGPGGEVIPPRLNLRDTIQVVDRDKTIGGIDTTLAEKYKGTFKDGTRQGSIAKQNQVQFTGERDAFEIFTTRDVGTKANPLFKIEPAELLDPLESMDRALSRIVHSTWMDDYKTFAVEHWLRNAEKWMKFEPGATRYSPFHEFHHVQYRTEAPPDIKFALEQNRQKILQFIGQPSNYENFLHVAGQKLLDWSYGAFGGKVGERLVPYSNLALLKDPFKFMRQVAFHAKLGLFAVPQLLVQMQTYSTILAMAPRSAVPATMAAHLAQLARLNPNMVDHLDTIASAVRMPGFHNWKPGEFKEAWTEMKKAGFGLVSGEYALLDTHMAPGVFRSGMGEFLDAGAFFFREGERSVRMGAYFTAFKEMRQANPTGRMTDAMRRQILERADTLTVNMSRASSSMLHTGVFSLPAQFLSYQLRLAELFFSRRLADTSGERAAARMRMMAFNAALYGAPTTFGVTGIPASDAIRRYAMGEDNWIAKYAPGAESLRKYALDNGYIVGEKWLQTAFMEGLPAVFTAWATGKGDLTDINQRVRTGTVPNIGDRFAPQGFEVIREFTRGDKAWWELMGGAAFSTVFNSLGAWGDGFWHMAGSMLRRDGKFAPKLEDAVDAFKEISSLHTMYRGILAFETGNWLSKKEFWLEKVTPKEAAALSVFGLQPQQVADLHLVADMRKQRGELHKSIEEDFIREFRRGMRASKDGNHEQSREFMNRAMYYLDLSGYPQERRPNLMSRAVEGHIPLTEKTYYDYYLKDVNKEDFGKFRDIQKRYLKLREERK